jgi:beta-N-acetylhexosaminidase
MGDLDNYLGNLPTEIPAIPLNPTENFEESLFSADWIVFSILRSSENIYGSSALKTLLDTRQDLVLDKRVVVFAHDVPYELDSTDISKIDVYYSMYAKSEPFIEYAARLLFQEATADGSSPVSIPGIGYDLIEITSPDSGQIIDFSVSINDELITEETEADNPLVGDMLEVRTSIITDMNGNQVPDGTPVEFILSYQGENIPSLELTTTTTDGVARINETLNRGGALEIRVESLSARISEIVLLNVQGETVESGTETPSPEEPLTPTAPMETADTNASPTEEGAGSDTNGGAGDEAVDLDDLFLSLITTSITGGVAFLISSMYQGAFLYRLRFVIVTIVGSLIGYNYLALGLPGSSLVFNELGRAAGVILSIIGGGMAFAAVLYWWRRTKRS